MDSLAPTTYTYRGLSRIKFKDMSGCLDLHKANTLGDSTAVDFLNLHCFESNISKTIDSNFYTNPIHLFNKIDSIEQFNNFYARNQIHIGAIGKKIFGLPINQCLTKKIIAFISVDKNGMIAGCKLLKGTSNIYLDSLINFNITNFKGEWTPFFKDEKAISYSEVFSFGATGVRIYKDAGPWIEKTYERNINEQVRYEYRYITEKTNYNYSKQKCENNEYYYRKGIEEFTKKKYKLAKYNFIKAIGYNINDHESRYNLAMSYLRLGKNEKACEHFKICSNRGDKDALKQFKELCNDN